MQSWKSDVIKTHATHSIAYMSDKSDQMVVAVICRCCIWPFHCVKRSISSEKNLLEVTFENTKVFLSAARKTLCMKLSLPFKFNMKKLALI